jgi:uncharacterized protein YceK
LFRTAFLTLVTCLLLSGCAGSRRVVEQGHAPPTVQPTAETGTIAGRVTAGRVTDVLGQPLPFVMVLLKGTSLGVRADASGNYVLSRVPVGTYTIFPRMVGYNSPEQVISVRPGQISTANFRVDELPSRHPPSK